MSSNALRIAVIAGDGIGKEVVPEGLRVLEAAAAKFDLALEFDEFDFASCDYFAKHGEMMPGDWKAQIGGHDAIYFGAVGWPETVPDHISLWGSLLKFRRLLCSRIRIGSGQNLNRGPAVKPGFFQPLEPRLQFILWDNVSWDDFNDFNEQSVSTF